MSPSRARFWPSDVPRSIDLDIGGLADRLPFFEIRSDEGAELLRRAGIGDRAELGDRILHLRSLEAFVDRGVELVDDRRGRALRCHDAVESEHLVIGNAL